VRAQELGELPELRAPRAHAARRARKHSVCLEVRVHHAQQCFVRQTNGRVQQALRRPRVLAALRVEPDELLVLDGELRERQQAARLPEAAERANRLCRDVPPEGARGADERVEDEGAEDLLQADDVGVERGQVPHDLPQRK